MPTAILTLVCHAATPATRSAAFPTPDESLDPAGVAAAERAAKRIRRVDTAWTSPDLRSRQTATALGLHADIEPALRDLNCGTWTGRTLDEVAAADPAGVAAWLTDAYAAPHGGESIGSLLERVTAWLGEVAPLQERLVAVTHASVIRAAIVAALEAKPDSFWRIDIAPLSRVRLRSGTGRWTLVSMER